MNWRKCEISKFSTILVIVCQTFRELDGPKASDDLSSYPLRLLKEKFIVFYVKHHIKMTQRSRKSETFPDEFCGKFRGLERKHSTANKYKK